MLSPIVTDDWSENKEKLRKQLSINLLANDFSLTESVLSLTCEAKIEIKNNNINNNNKINRKIRTYRKDLGQFFSSISAELKLSNLWTKLYLRVNNSVFFHNFPKLNYFSHLCISNSPLHPQDTPKNIIFLRFQINKQTNTHVFHWLGYRANNCSRAHINMIISNELNKFIYVPFIFIPPLYIFHLEGLNGVGSWIHVSMDI